MPYRHPQSLFVRIITYYQQHLRHQQQIGPSLNVSSTMIVQQQQQQTKEKRAKSLNLKHHQKKNKNIYKEQQWNRWRLQQKSSLGENVKKKHRTKLNEEQNELKGTDNMNKTTKTNEIIICDINPKWIWRIKGGTTI